MQDPRGAVTNDQPTSIVFQRIHAVGRLLGLGITIDGLSLSLTLDTSSALRSPPWSSGEVAHPEPIVLGRPVPGGLACPAIFGDWHDPDIRRFGHVSLACFVLPLPTRQLLAPLLGDTEDELFTLNAVDPDALLGRIQAAHAAGQTLLGRSPLDFVWWSIPVISPILRAEDPQLALVLERETDFGESLHDGYWRVVNRARRLRRLIELEAPTMIIENERRMVISGVDELLLNVDLNEPRLCADDDEVSVRVYDALSLFFAALGSKLIEIGERNARMNPEANSWLARAARIGRGEGGGEPRLVALWRLAVENPVEPLTDEMLAALMLSDFPR